MPAVAIRPGNELALAKRLVRDHLDRDGHRAERAAPRAERSTDLVVGGRPERAAQHLEQLCVAEAVVPADERKHDGAVRLRHRHRFRRRCEVDAEVGGELLARGHAGGLHLGGGLEPLGKLRRARNATRDLQIGGVVAPLAGDQRVLARP